MRSLRFLSFCLLGCCLHPALTRAAEKPPQSPQQALNAAPAPDERLLTYDKASDTMIVLYNAFGPKPEGTYRFDVMARAADDATLRLWLARSATPDFAGASWEEVTLRDAHPNPGNPGVYNFIREAKIAAGSKTQKYLALRGEVEITRDGATQRFFSPTALLPAVKTLWWRHRDGSQQFYATSSAKAVAMQLRFARSATRDFAKTDWQILPMTAGRDSYSGVRYEAVLPAASASTPWVKVYADAELEDSALHVASPTLIWNGLAFPRPASELRGGTCPLHGTSADVVPIIYGMAASGGPPGAIYAGCIVGPGSPTWHCNLCDCSWGDFQAETARNNH